MKLIAILAALVLLIAMLRKAVKPKRKLTIDEIHSPYINYATRKPKDNALLSIPNKRRW